MPRPPQYQHTTLASARAQLATRLQDSGNAYWGVSELNSFLVAGLRTWQALTGAYRERGVFVTAATVPFYDLTSKLPVQFGYSVTDSQLITEIQQHLLEPTGIPWVGSNQFTLAQIVTALQARRNQFLRDTGIVVTRLPLMDVAAAPVGRVQLDETILSVRRASWLTVDGINFSLFRTDEFGLNNFAPGWDTPDTPSSYSVAVTPPVSLQLAPPPNDIGKLDLCVTQSGSDLDPVSGATLLNVPDDFTQYLKFGALADLLGADGQCRDPLRAAYAETRYQEGVSLGRLFPGGLLVRVNDQSLYVDATANLDAFNNGWQNFPGAPWVAGWAGRNLLALSPVPDGIYSVAVDGVRNMPVPAFDEDFIQIGQEYLDVLLDYSQHLASFKMGGQEFTNTQAQFARFIQAAGRVNLRLKAEAFYSQAITQAAGWQAGIVPMETRQ